MELDTDVLPSDPKTLDLDLSSSNSAQYIEHCQRVGWPLGGAFPNLLSSADYLCKERGGRVFPREWYEEVAVALSVLIFEQ